MSGPHPSVGARDSTLTAYARIQRQSKYTYQSKERGRRKGNKTACSTHGTHLWVVSNRCIAGRPGHLSPGSRGDRATPEKEIPPL